MKLDVASLRCIAQVALLGAVTPNLRAVVVAFENECIQLFFYYDQVPSEEEEELAEEVATEFVSDCTEYMIKTKKITVSYPEKIPDQRNSIFIYHRYEP